MSHPTFELSWGWVGVVTIMCPLCHNHVDSQSLSFQCNYYKDKMKIHSDMKDIDTPDITLETAITVTEMMRLRENELNGN